jgi:hypothetical protein
VTISKENGDWAFPTNSEKMGVSTTGMTLRQYFAGQALSGLLAKYGIDNQDHFMEQIAIDAYDMADKMIERRYK